VLLRNFTAIDFETANRNRASICSVGLVKVRKGTIADTFHSLIRPTAKLAIFNYYNVRVHGITGEDVMDAPLWAELFSEVQSFIGKDVLVAHNASFDKSCLVQANATIGVRRDYDFVCTCRNARRLLPGLVNYRLPTVTDALAVGLANHHDALADARAAAEIALALAQLGELVS
jgi:DNA polymerase-3 subunit epsilon